MLETGVTGLDFIPPSHSGPVWSFVLAILVFGLGGGAGIVWMLLRARALSKMQRHEHDVLVQGAASALVPGPGRVVFGTVACDDASGVAVRVTIVQNVKNHSSKNSHWHTWDEASRSIEKTLFHLTRDDGQLVYVEPGDDLLVVDALERVYPQARPGVRLRIADVRRGERFYAYGDLHRAHHPSAAGGAYRGGGIGMVLRPPSRASRGRMLLATDAIRDRHSRQIALLWRWGALFGVAWTLLNAVFNVPFVEAALLGRSDRGDVVSHRVFTTRNKNSTTTHYELTVECADGFVLVQEVPSSTYTSVVRDTPSSMFAEPVNEPVEPGAEPARVKIPLLRVGDSTRASFLGSAPSIHTVWLAISLGGLAVAVAVSVFEYRRRAAWYDRKKLNERGGTGHWNEVRPYAPVPPEKGAGEEE
jgi:hypothetical protein